MAEKTTAVPVYPDNEPKTEYFRNERHTFRVVITGECSPETIPEGLIEHGMRMIRPKARVILRHVVTEFYTKEY